MAKYKFLFSFLILAFLNCANKKQLTKDNNFKYYPFQLNKHWGYYDKESNKTIDAIYEEADFFRNGFAKVKLHGKYGFLNENGELQIKTKYDAVSIFNGLGFAKVERSSKVYWINKKGEKSKYEPSRISSHGDINRYRNIPELKDYVLENEQGKKAINFTDYKSQTDFEFDSIISCNLEFSIVASSNKYGFHRIDMPHVHEGKKLHTYKTVYKYDEINLEFLHPPNQKQPYQFARIRTGDKWGIMSIVTMKEIIAPKYIRVVDLSMDRHPTLFLVEFEENRFGYVDFNGEELFPGGGGGN